MDDVDLEPGVLERLDVIEQGLPPKMGALLSALRQRVGVRPGYFTHPLALPVLQLPRWLCPDVSETTLTTLAAAGATGYLAVRLQDDLIDEGIGEPGEVALLSGLLLHHHDAALASLAPGPMFWLRAGRTWAAYGEAMLLERALSADPEAPYSEATFSQVLDRSRPLALPTAALLCHREEAARLADLDALISALVSAHQLQTDLLDLERDCAAGRRTWLLTMLGEPASPAALRKALLFGGGLDRLADRVGAGLAALEGVAQAQGVDEAAAWARRRRAALERTRQGVQEAFVTALLG